MHEDRRTAFHEAGHALIAVALSAPLEQVAVIPKGDTAGRATLGAMEHPAEPLPVGDQSLGRLYVIAWFDAGAVCEAIAFADSVGFENDEAQAGAAVAEVETALGVSASVWRPVLRQTLDAYLRAHWPAVLRLSDGLLAGGTLSGHRVRDLAGPVAPLNLTPVAEAIRVAAGVDL